MTWATPNLHADPDCKAFPFYAHRGLGKALCTFSFLIFTAPNTLIAVLIIQGTGAGASYGQSNFAISAPASMAKAMA